MLPDPGLEATLRPPEPETRNLKPETAPPRLPTSSGEDAALQNLMIPFFLSSCASFSISSISGV